MSEQLLAIINCLLLSSVLSIQRVHRGSSLLCPHCLHVTEHRLFAGSVAEGSAACGSDLLALGSRLVSALTWHAVGYKTVALTGCCLPPP